MADASIARDQHVLGRIALIRFGRGRKNLAHLDHPLGVGKPGGGAQNYRGIETLADGAGLANKILRFLTVGRLQQGDRSKACIDAVVLFVLRAVHTWIVRADDDQSRPHAGVGHAHQGVGGHVDSHVLHCD